MAAVVPLDPRDVAISLAKACILLFFLYSHVCLKVQEFMEVSINIEVPILWMVKKQREHPTEMSGTSPISGNLQPLDSVIPSGRLW